MGRKVRSCLREVVIAPTMIGFAATSLAQTPNISKPNGYQLDFKTKEDFRGTHILRQSENLAYAFVTDHAAADADGAPNAYHPDDVGKRCTKDPHVGLDCPANA